jgi:uncharacterized membrane protein AbrB (regulator of aidB expression)
MRRMAAMQAARVIFISAIGSIANRFAWRRTDC